MNGGFGIDKNKFKVGLYFNSDLLFIYLCNQTINEKQYKFDMSFDGVLWTYERLSRGENLRNMTTNLGEKLYGTFMTGPEIQASPSEIAITITLRPD